LSGFILLMNEMIFVRSRGCIYTFSLHLTLSDDF
jgi:hypothetical protein